MASLPSLPDELLFLICNEVHPSENPSHGDLDALAALARTNRRLFCFVDPLLYHKSIQCHSHLPLAWAAKLGVAGTLRKALAAGANPNHVFRARVSPDDLEHIGGLARAGRDWVHQQPASEPAHMYWPPIQNELPAPLGYLDPGEAIEDYVTREYTALHLAAREGHDGVASMLLDHGALVDSLSRLMCGCCPLLSLWQTLSCEPWNNDEAESRSRTPLHLAICSARPETARLLVSRGAEVAWNDLAPGQGSGHYALHQAAASGYAGLVDFMLESNRGLHVDLPDDQGLSAFYHAYANRHWDSTVDLLLARGADINLPFSVRPPSGGLQAVVTPLAEACRLGRFEDAIKLINLGADANLPLELFRADQGLLAGGEPLQPSIQSRVPLLHICCMDFGDRYLFPSLERIWGPALTQSSSRPTLMARLLATGITPDTMWHVGGGHGETPLTVAARHLNVPAITALLNSGADPNTSDSRGRTALMSVLVPECHECEHELRDEGPYWRQFRLLGFPLTRSVYDTSRLRVARALLDAGVPLNSQDSDGNTALHLLFLKALDEIPLWRRMDWQDQRPLVGLLLARGANPCIRNREGASFLHLVAKQGRAHVLEVASAHCGLDLVDALPADEIAAILAAISESGLHRQFAGRFGRFQQRSKPLRSPSSDNPGDGEDEPAALRRHLQCLIDPLMNLDRSGRMAAMVPSILLSDSGRLAQDIVFSEMLCSKALERTTFKPEETQALLHHAIIERNWRMAHMLLREPPEMANVIDLRDECEHSLLSLVVSSTFSRHLNPDVDKQLVAAGANVHLFLWPTPVDLSSVDISVMTPLKLALRRPDNFDIDWMLRRQPIRGNPHAAVPLYLHWAVALPWRPASWLDEESRKVKWSARADSIRALLAAGADTRQLDTWGNTAWSRLLRELVSDTANVVYTTNWFRALSRDVDINHENDDGCSVADYLEILLKEPNSAKVINVYLRLVTQENGKKRIEWRK